MKTLSEMNNRELFAVLTGSDVIQQAYLQKIVRLHLKYVHENHIPEDADLQTMVREYNMGLYREKPEQHP